MTLKIYMTIGAVVGVLLGFALLVFPNAFLQSFGIVLNTSGYSIARLLGALIFSIGIQAWLIRNEKLSSVIRAVLWSILISHILTGVLGFSEVISGIVRVPILLIVVVHGFFVVGAVYFLFSKKTGY